MDIFIASAQMGKSGIVSAYMKKAAALMGKEATITDPNSDYYGEWGIIKGFDGDYYHIALWNGDTCLAFARSEFRVKRH